MTTLQKHLVRLFALLFVAAVSSTALVAQGTIGTVITISGFVLDNATLLPVEASYSVFDEANKKMGQTRTASATDGYLVTGLKPGGTYKIRIEDPRYFKQEFTVNLPQTGKYVELSKDFVVRKLMPGRRIAISPAPFDRNKAEVKGGTEEDLGLIAKMLIMNPGVKIELTAYADEELSSDKASEISQQRGNAIKQFFESAGVNGSRITVNVASTVDPLDPPPLRKGAKGKRYIGPVYMMITSV